MLQLVRQQSGHVRGNLSVGSRMKSQSSLLFMRRHHVRVVRQSHTGERDPTQRNLDQPLIALRLEGDLASTRSAWKKNRFGPHPGRRTDSVQLLEEEQIRSTPGRRTDSSSACRTDSVQRLANRFGPAPGEQIRSSAWRTDSVQRMANRFGPAHGEQIRPSAWRTDSV
jgi:hypothetical protein